MDIQSSEEKRVPHPDGSGELLTEREYQDFLKYYPEQKDQAAPATAADT